MTEQEYNDKVQEEWTKVLQQMEMNYGDRITDHQAITFLLGKLAVTNVHFNELTKQTLTLSNAMHALQMQMMEIMGDQMMDSGSEESGGGYVQ